MLQNPYVMLAGVVVFVGAIIGAFFEGRSYEGNARDAAQLVAEREAADLVDEQENAATGITSTISAEAEVGRANAREITRILTNEVSNNVTREDDDACPIPSGAVRLWDNSIRAELPSIPRATGQPDDGTGTSDFALVLSDIITTDIANNGRHHECRAQLLGLQEWLRRQEESSRQYETRRAALTN